jgi:hypothetical protein
MVARLRDFVRRLDQQVAFAVRFEGQRDDLESLCLDHLGDGMGTAQRQCHVGACLADTIGVADDRNIDTRAFAGIGDDLGKREAGNAQT